MSLELAGLKLMGDARLVVLKLGDRVVFRVRQKNLEKLKTSISTKLKKSFNMISKSGKKVDMEMHRLKKVNDFRPET